MDNVLLSDGERLDKVNEDVTLIQKKDGLTFGSDAFLLASYMKAQRGALAVELGAGTGIISLLCAARGKFESIHMFEIQQEFSDLCRRNIELNGFSDRITVRCADVRELTQKDIPREADVVFANPPYMTADGGKKNASDAKYIARHEICGTIEHFCAAATRLLKFGGDFWCVWRPDRLSPLFSALSHARLEPKLMTFVCADAQTSPSMVLVCAKKGASPSMKVTPPLILHDVASRKDMSRTLTPLSQEIYDTMSFESFFAQSR